MGEEVLLGACHNNFAPPKSTKMVGRRRAIEVTGAGITGRFNAVCLASDRTTATSSWSPLHPPLAMALIPRIQAQERQWDRPTDRPTESRWLDSSAAPTFSLPHWWVLYRRPPAPPKSKSPHFHVPCTCCSCMIGSIAVMQSNDMGFDWLGCQSPRLHRSDQMLRCLLCAASTNFRIFSRREKNTNGFVLFWVLFS